MPADSFKVKAAHQEALERGDLRSAVSIERLPHFHPAAIDSKTMAELKAERIRQDDPHAAAEIEIEDQAISDLEVMADDSASAVRRISGTGSAAIRLDDGRLVDGEGRELDPDTLEPIDANDVDSVEDDASKTTQVA